MHVIKKKRETKKIRSINGDYTVNYCLKPSLDKFNLECIPDFDDIYMF